MAVEDEVFRQQVAAVSPHCVTTYLQQRGWTVVASDDRWMRFQYDRPGLFNGAEVLVPLWAGYSDYPRRLEEAIRTLGQVEHRLAADVVTDLAMAKTR